MDLAGLMEDFVSAVQFLPEYEEILCGEYRETERLIQDLLHFAELYEYDGQKAEELAERLTAARRRRRAIKNEQYRLYQFQTSIGSAVNRKKAADALSEIRRREGGREPSWTRRKSTGAPTPRCRQRSLAACLSTFRTSGTIWPAMTRRSRTSWSRWNATAATPPRGTSTSGASGSSALTVVTGSRNWLPYSCLRSASTARPCGRPARRSWGRWRSERGLQQ